MCCSQPQQVAFLVLTSSSLNVTAEVLEYVNTMSEKVKNGEIKVPSTKEEFEAQYSGK